MRLFENETLSPFLVVLFFGVCVRAPVLCVFSLIGRVSLDTVNLYNLFRANNAAVEAYITNVMINSGASVQTLGANSEMNLFYICCRS
jgi:hypothetical protein